jgi:phosphate transport system substrate-binding protein
MGSFPKPTVTRRCGPAFIISIFLFSFLTFGLDSFAKAQNAVILVGSGSSVPAPLYSRWATEYGKRNPKVQMRYLLSSTNEGIKQISHGAGDFGAGEAPLTENDRKEGGLTELPVVVIAIVPIYNLPDVHQELRLSGEVLADIFLGDVKTWNAPAIAKLNPEIALPNLPIKVVNRPAGKGSNYVFTDFLSKASPRFRAQVGVTSSPKWPVGEAVERSSDMAEEVKNTRGSIGYVEYQYAVKGGISQAAVLNPAGKFVEAFNESIAAACQAAEEPGWKSFSASLIDARGADSYPIASFSWIYLRTNHADAARSAALSDLLSWIYTDGQRYATQEGYSALPAPLLDALKKKLKSLE